MKFTKKVLKNGIRVIAVPMKDNPTATVLVLVEAGSKYETKRINGLSHFLEHMCFKGTTKRPKSIDISKELDALGAESNAFTDQEYTGYYAKADAKHFKQIFDVVSDVYLNSTFPETEMEKEKGVIIEEINMYEDLPPQHVRDMMIELLYGDQPAGWNVAGKKENIKAMKRGDFIKYKKEHYVPESTIVVVAGKVNAKEVIKEANKYFGKIKRSPKSKKLKVKEKQTKPEILFKYKETDQSHFSIAFRSMDIFDKRNPILSVMAGILGGGMSSRLFQKLREEMGVCYYVRATPSALTDHGYFEISAGVDNTRAEEVIKAILNECKKLKEQLVDSDELNKVKEYLIGNSKLNLESSNDWAVFYGGQEVIKRETKVPEEKFKAIRAVTVHDIKKLANAIFRNDKLNLSIIGPVKNKTNLAKVLKL